MTIIEAVQILEKYKGSSLKNVAIKTLVDEVKRINKNKGMYPEGYKNYKIDPKYYKMRKWGDHVVISKKYNISLSTLVKSFRKGYCTKRIMEALNDYFKQ